MGYRKDIKKIEETMTMIHESYLEPLETSLWSFDILQMEAQVRGLLTLPLIKKVAVYEIDAGQSKMVFSLGAIEDTNYQEQIFPLNYISESTVKNIGTLVVYAGMDEIHHQVIWKIFSTFFIKVIEIMILSMCILMIFHHMIMKHLGKIEYYLGNLDRANGDKKLVLDRSMGDKTDILDSIVWAINRIIRQLIMDIAHLKNVEVKLTQTNQELIQNREMMEEQEWLRGAQVAVGEILRDDQDIEALARRLLSYLCPKFKAGAGLFYYVDEQKKTIRAVGSYALKMIDENALEFTLGEGLVGQVVADKKSNLLTPPSDHRLSISSALGQAKSEQILLYPFIRDGHVTCVVEMGSFNGFKPEHLALLAQISESVAIATESAVVMTHRVLLIHDIMQKADELKRQGLAFRQSEEKFRMLFNHSKHLIVITDKDGTIQDVNSALILFTGQHLIDILGIPVWNTTWWAEEKQAEHGLRRAFGAKINGEAFHESFQIKDKQGNVSAVSFMFKPIRVVSQEPWGMMMDGVFLTDV